jgi:hypothetical protein
LDNASGDKREDSVNFTLSTSLLTGESLRLATASHQRRLGELQWEVYTVRDGKPGDVRLNLTEADWVKANTSMKRRRLTPYMVRGYLNEQGEQRYACVWSPGAATEVNLNMSRGELDEALKARQNSVSLIFVDAWVVGSEPRFNAVWAKVPLVASWVFTTPATEQRDFDRLSNQKLSVICVTGWQIPGEESHRMFVFNNQPERLGCRNYLEAEYRDIVRNLGPNARPLLVDISRERANRLYHVIWGHDGDKLNWDVSAFRGEDPSAEMQKMFQNGFRPVNIAVGR